MNKPSFHIATRLGAALVGIALLGLTGPTQAIQASGTCPKDLSEGMNMADMSAGTHEMPAMSPKAMELVDSECVNCHGTKGISHSHDVPHLAGQNPLYLCEWLAGCRTEGKRCESHEDLAEKFSDEEIIGIAQHYGMMPNFGKP